MQDESSLHHARHRMQPQMTEPRQERSEEHTSELQSRRDLVCRLLLEKKKNHTQNLKHDVLNHHKEQHEPVHTRHIGQLRDVMPALRVRYRTDRYLPGCSSPAAAEVQS